MTSQLLFKGMLAAALTGGALWLSLSPAAVRQAPELTLTTLDGERVALRELRGHPVLVNFWSLSCASCIEELPLLRALYSQLAARGLEIIGISVPYDPPSHVLAMSRGMQIPYLLALDVRGEAARAFGDVQLIPTTFLISAEGRVVHRQTGVPDLEHLRNLVLQQLGDEAAPAVYPGGS